MKWHLELEEVDEELGAALEGEPPEEQPAE